MTKKAREARIKAYERAYNFVASELAAQTVALRIRGYSDPSSELDLLFEPASGYVFGQVRLTSTQLEALGERLQVELEGYGFVRISSRQPEDLPVHARDFEAFVGLDDDDVVFVKPELPSQSEELAELTERIVSMISPKRLEPAPDIDRLVPNRFRRGPKSKEALPLIPRGGGYSSGPGDPSYDPGLLVGLGDEYAGTTIGEAGRSAAAAEPAKEVGATIEGTISLGGGSDGGAGGGEDPPRSAFALLQADDVVIALTPFELTVGISSTPMPDVLGDNALVRPAWSVGPYDLQIDVVADGFSLRKGESPRLLLPVDKGDAYPRRVLHLTPQAQSKPVVSRAVQAIYSINGQTIGHAFRPISVVRSQDLVADAPKPEAPETVSVPMEASEHPPDLTANITFAISKADGRLSWTLTSPHDVTMPRPGLASDPGADRAGFARQIVNGIGADEGKAGIYESVVGKGMTIADNVPPEFWETLRAIAAITAPAPPRVLLLSAEPFIPWELAVMPQRVIDSTRPPFLAAQAIVGRWVLKLPPPPASQPPEAVQVTDVAVISGDYTGVLYAQTLPEAQLEATDLEALLGATPVPATYVAVLACLKGSPPAQLLHFAVHGKYNQSGVEDGLQLIDNQRLRALRDDVVRAVSLGGEAPFVFLNACQVGSSNEVLGTYGGIAAAFLEAGASAVIAPLWSVDDAVAKDIALAFYRAVQKGGLPAEILRDQRAEFNDQSVTATPAAYQFFGDPRLMLSLT